MTLKKIQSQSATHHRRRWQTILEELDSGNNHLLQKMMQPISSRLYIHTIFSKANQSTYSTYF
jgi:hypothetical protein